MPYLCNVKLKRREKMKIKNNTLRFWLTNRMVWLILTFIILLAVLCGGNDKEVNTFITCTLFALYFLAGFYVAENANASERILLKKISDYFLTEPKRK